MPLFGTHYGSYGPWDIMPEEHTRRTFARTVVDIAGDALVLFGAGHEEIHILLACDDLTTARRLGTRLTRALRPLVIAREWGGKFELSRGQVYEVDPNRLRMWLGRTVLPDVSYCEPEPAELRSATCAPDLLGVRRLPGFEEPRWDALPGFGPDDARSLLDLPEKPIEPISFELLARCRVSRIADAAAAALGVGPGPFGPSPHDKLARSAAATLALQAGFTTAEVASAIGVRKGYVRKIADQPVEDALLETIRRRLALEELIAPQIELDDDDHDWPLSQAEIDASNDPWIYCASAAG